MSQNSKTSSCHEEISILKLFSASFDKSQKHQAPPNRKPYQIG